MTLAARAIGIALLSLFAAQPNIAQDITLAEARTLARVALDRGEPQLALNIAKGLLQADPNDADVLMLVAVAQAQLGNPINGRRAAARAYRNTSDRETRYRAATTAASLSMRAERPTLTQIWLRRASQHTDDKAAQARIAQNYRQTRAINPWSFDLGVNLRPSSNVNGGAKGDVQIVDGLEDTLPPGQLTGSAQALSGMVGEGRLTLGYRLRQSQTSRTDLRGRILVRRIALSNEARDILATNPQANGDVLGNGDFGSTYADVTLLHSFKVGSTPGNVARVGLAFGGTWYGGDADTRLYRLEGERIWRLGDGASFSLSGSVSERDQIGSRISDSQSFALSAGYSAKTQSGARYGLSLAISKTNSDNVNRDNTAVSARASYQFAQNWGPAQASLGVSVQHVDFDQFVVSQFPTTVLAPGGRQDTAAYADLTLFFPDLDYAGFAPTVTLRAGSKESNISFFETEEVSVSVGIQSKF